MLLEIAAQNLRNLQTFSLEPGAQLNVISGLNAAGKTSLLEAIYVLSRGRTFRTSRLDEIVCTGESECWVRGRVKDQASDRATRLGLARTSGRTVCRIDGEAASNAAELAGHLPVQILHPESHLLLSGAPAYRRAFIDWGCFYQDSSFFPLWNRFRRVLNQRNAALKRGLDSRVLSSLESEFCTAAELLDRARSTYVAHLAQSLDKLKSLWPEGAELKLDYRRGWSIERELPELLFAEREQARRVGHSLAGPQRADLIVKSSEHRVSMIFSRGQLKRTTFALLLAQIAAFEDMTKRDVVILVDDLSSELDNAAREVVLRTLVSVQRQCFITALSTEDLDLGAHQNCRLFHVEHGRLSELI